MFRATVTGDETTVANHEGHEEEESIITQNI